MTGRGVFVTLEGGEGAGKSTQIGRIAERCRGLDREVVTTREPGGSPSAEDVRALLVSGEPGRWQPLAELCLVLAARTQHLHEVIRPALARGAVVICDRFADSTRVYQGLAGGLGLDLVERLMAPVLDGLEPDLTVILDLPTERAAERLAARGGVPQRFERKGRAFHEAVRRGFLEIAGRSPDRCVVVDATLPVDAVEATIAERLMPLLAR